MFRTAEARQSEGHVRFHSCLLKIGRITEFERDRRGESRERGVMLYSGKLWQRELIYFGN